jgi:hypothetical protein
MRTARSGSGTLRLVGIENADRGDTIDREVRALRALAREQPATGAASQSTGAGRIHSNDTASYPIALTGATDL